MDNAAQVTNSPADPSQAAGAVAVTAKKPMAPRVHPSLLSDTERLLGPIRQGSLWRQRSERAEKTLKALCPQRQLENFDHIPSRMRNEWMRRQVRTPYLYLQNLMATAMSAPMNYEARYVPKPRAQAYGEQAEPGADPLLTTVGDHWKLVVDDLLKDAGAQEKLNAWAQDADAFGMAVLKVSFHSEEADNLVADVTMRDDESDQLRRIIDLRRKVALREITPLDAEARELADLEATLGNSAELSVVKRLVVEHLAGTSVQIDPSIENTENLYEAQWMAHFIVTTRGAVRADYPYRSLGADGAYERFEGVHPDHIDGAQPLGFDQNQWELLRSRRRKEAAGDGQEGDGDPVLLIELHHRLRNRVYLFCDGVPYPIKTIIPKRAPAQWYPFIFLVPRRMPGDPHGIGSVELGEALQRVSHLKVSDGNMQRYLGMSRMVYDKGTVDEQDIKNLGETVPGAAVGLDLKGDDLSKVLQNSALEYDPRVFDDTREQQDLRRTGAIPEQMNGVTGSADYAAEVQAAMQGAQISSSWVQGQIKLALERFHEVVLDLVLQNITRDEAQQIAGKYVLWPEFLEEQEAQAFDQQVHRAIQGQLLKMQWVASALGRPINELAQRQYYEEQRQRIIMENTGWPEIVSRRDLQRRLGVKARIAMNKDLERNTKRQDFNALLQTLVPSGVTPDRKALGKTLVEMYDLNAETAGMFSVDPNQLAADLAQIAGQNPGALSPEAVQQLLLLAQAAAAQQGLLPAPSGAPANEGQPPG